MKRLQFSLRGWLVGMAWLAILSFMLLRCEFHLAWGTGTYWRFELRLRCNGAPVMELTHNTEGVKRPC
jgi:hypothetical protein